jgi:hypothetical protein
MDVADEILHVEMLDARRVERGRAADEAMDFVALTEEKLGEVGAVLAGDTGDECALFHKGDE